MANWKKVIVSGSQAELAGISASSLPTLDPSTNEFQVLVTGSNGAFFVTGSNALAGSNQNLDAGAGIVITNNEISASVDDVSIEINNSNQLAVISASIGTGQIATSLGTLNNNQFTGSISENIINLTNLNWLSLSNNEFKGEIPEKICDLNVDWSYITLTTSYSLSNNQFCPPYPVCIETYIGFQDTTNCD